MKCQIKVIKELLEIFPEYQPKVGQIYDAELSPQAGKRFDNTWGSGKMEFCVITVLDKKIVLRKGEYEIVRS